MNWDELQFIERENIRHKWVSGIVSTLIYGLGITFVIWAWCAG